MKRFSILILLTFYSLSFAQNIETNRADVVWGSESKESKKIIFHDVIGSDATGFYTLKKKLRDNSKVLIEHYNRSANKTNEAWVELRRDKKPLEFEAFMEMGDKIYLFSSFKNRKLKTKFLFAQELNKKTLQPSTKLVKVSEQNYENQSAFRSGSFSFVVSQDHSKLLIVHQPGFDKKETEKFGFNVFDAGMNEIWQKNVKMPYENKYYAIEDFIISNQGTVFTCGITSPSLRQKTNKRSGESNYGYEVLSFGKNIAQNKYTISLPGKFITDLKLAVNENEDFVVAGFYSEQGLFSIKGAFYQRISGKTGKVEKTSTKEFDANFITLGFTERQKKKTKKKLEKGKNQELYEYDLDDLIIKENGEVYLIGEQYYVRVVTHTSTDANGNTRTTTTYHYYYNDIIVVKMDTQGEIAWAKKILKSQHSVNDGGFYSSYVMHEYNNRMYFIFNDNIKNMHNKGDEPVKNMNRKSLYIAIVELNPNGSQNRKALSFNPDVSTYCRPKASEQITDKELILYGQKRKTKQFARVIFK